MDVRFDDYMADQIGVAEMVYALAGESMTDEDRIAIDGYLAEHKRNRFGKVQTSCDMFGIDEHDLRERFAPYTQRFLN